MSTPDPRLGVAFNHLRGGDAAAAEALCRAVIAESGQATAFALLARVLAAQERHDEAASAVAQALARDPDCRPALLEAAALAQRRGEPAVAAEHMGHLCRLELGNAAFAFDHARLLQGLLQGLGRLEEAETAARRAAMLQPGFVEATELAGSLALAQGDGLVAIEDFRRASQRRPQSIEAWLGLARGADMVGDDQLAAHAYGRVLSIDDREPRALRGFGEVALQARDFASVHRAMARLGEVEPQAADVDLRDALAWWQEDDFPQAHAALARCLAKDPGDLGASWLQGHLPPTVVYEDMAQVQATVERWRETIERFEQLDPASPAMRKAYATVIGRSVDFFHHYLADPLPPLQKRWGALVRRISQANFPDPVLPAPTQRTRPHVVFVSSMLREHSVTRLFAGVLEGLDRKRLEITYCQAASLRDAMTDRLARAGDRLIQGGQSLARWRERLLELAPDVIVYLDVGMDARTQWLAAQRLAPVQCVLWGHPVTTGMDSIDVFISAQLMERDDAAQDYRERLCTLPRLGLSFATPAAAPPTPAQSGDRLRICMPQSIYKLLPLHDPILVRIAQALPQAQFVFVPNCEDAPAQAFRRRLGAAFERAGLDPAERIEVHARLPRERYQALVASADINLDTLRWSGGVSTLEILGHDIPTVTLPGASMRSRHTAGMLRLLELDQLIARDEHDYVRIAVELGRSAALRDSLRALIRARKVRLYDDAGIGPALQALLLELVARQPD